MGEALADAIADHDFTLTGSKPAALRQLNGFSQCQTVLHQATYRDIGFARSILSGQHNHYSDLARDQRIAVLVFGDAWQRLQSLKILLREWACKFAGRALAQHQHIQRISRAME